MLSLAAAADQALVGPTGRERVASRADLDNPDGAGACRWRLYRLRGVGLSRARLHPGLLEHLLLVRELRVVVQLGDLFGRHATPVEAPEIATAWSLLEAALAEFRRPKNADLVEANQVLETGAPILRRAVDQTLRPCGRDAGNAPAVHTRHRVTAAVAGRLARLAQLRLAAETHAQAQQQGWPEPRELERPR